jgi:hypothetical protein
MTKVQNWIRHALTLGVVLMGHVAFVFAAESGRTDPAALLGEPIVCPFYPLESPCSVAVPAQELGAAAALKDMELGRLRVQLHQAEAELDAKLLRDKAIAREVLRAAGLRLERSSVAELPDCGRMAYGFGYREQSVRSLRAKLGVTFTPELEHQLRRLWGQQSSGGYSPGN